MTPLRSMLYIFLLLAGCSWQADSAAVDSGGANSMDTSQVVPPSPNTSPPIEELRGLFDYDRSQRVPVTVVSVDARGTHEVQDITFPSPLGGEVPAFLVVPGGDGPHAALLFLHPQEPGDRSSFLDEAIGLADRGVVSLLIASPFRRPQAPPLVTYTPADADPLRQTVVDLRRAVDLLSERSDVDPGRIAFVGQNFGSSMGAVLSGIEDRLAGYVLMGGTPSRTQFWAGDDPRAQQVRNRIPPDRWQEFLEAIGRFDAVHYVPHAAPASLLYQFGTRDNDLPEATATSYAELASEPKEVRWYDTTNRFDDTARRDRESWLGELLTLRKD